MTQFSLEKWLENTSRKVVTKDGKPVTIVCPKSPYNTIVGFCGKDQYPDLWDLNGKFLKDRDSDFDLFFADEEEELTEFEKELVEILKSEGAPIGNIEKFTDKDKEAFHCYSKQLLDLARKELEKNIEDDAIEFAKSYMEDVNPSFEKVQESEELWKWKMSCLRGINKAYKQGKQDALKYSPKWRKAEKAEHERLFDERGALEIMNGNVYLVQCINIGNYYIPISELLTLPKEE